MAQNRDARKRKECVFKQMDKGLNASAAYKACGLSLVSRQKKEGKFGLMTKKPKEDKETIKLYDKLYRAQRKTKKKSK
tara:strand:+ start:200 stop:433 length:234 start_codon:yes stop_codon:yes gene_type:complete